MHVQASRQLRGTPVLLVICAALAAASLALPAAVGYDPWSWLVWGRELTRGALTSRCMPAGCCGASRRGGGGWPQSWSPCRCSGWRGLAGVGRPAARRGDGAGPHRYLGSATGDRAGPDRRRGDRAGVGGGGGGRRRGGAAPDV